jgi:two-component system cell cycle sensor histidine kinase/response regulator CckA
MAQSICNGATCTSKRNTILVVEDEASIRLLVGQVIERTGFRVLSAKDGQLGIEAFAGNAEEIVAVLLDLTMPKKGGLETLREIKSLRPQVPVLLMSGFDEEELGVRFQGEGASAYLCKPFTPKELLEKLGHVLGLKLKLGSEILG